MWTDVLKGALILDLETTGLRRGSGIHELALYNLDTRQLYEYIIKPQQALAVVKEQDQDITRLASSAYDIHKLQRHQSWPELITAQQAMEAGKQGDWPEVIQSLKTNNRFLYDALESDLYPHLKGLKENPASRLKRADRLQRWGVRSAVLGQEVDAGEAFRSLSRHMQGQTIFIANSAFEAKQIGAHMDAMRRAGIDIDMRKTLETSNPRTEDILHVTGVEVNAARAQAQGTGDWTTVWKAYQKHTPKAGETAVRDILDITRAFVSYGKKLGLTGIADVRAGQAIDTTFRLFGSLESDPVRAKQLMGFKEVHRAAEDAAISEAYVLRNATKYTAALQAVHEQTEWGQELVKQASRKEGLLYKAGLYFQRLEHIYRDLEESNLVKRLERAQLDIWQDQHTMQVSGIAGYRSIASRTASDEQVDIRVPRHERMGFGSMEEFVPWLEQQRAYQHSPTSVSELWAEMQASLSGAEDQRAALAQFVEEKTMTSFDGRRMSKVQAKMEAEADILLSLENQNMGKTVTRMSNINVKRHLMDAVSNINIKSVGRGAAAAAGLLTMAGVVWSMADGNPQRPRTTSAAIGNYDLWKEHQEAFYGLRDQELNDGMQERGLNAGTRRRLTDFGSPYRGPYASQQALVDQELLREREKWLNKQYGARYSDPTDDAFGMRGPFRGLNNLGRQGYRYVQGGQAVADGTFQGMQGNLMSINIKSGNWKLDVEDADTVILRKGGLVGAVSSFFGLNKGYSFRLAGIDAPETDHGKHSYHAPQPYAETATEIFRGLVEGANNVELVFDPDNTTYGRMMAAVIADDKNLNYEAVRLGLAAHLPYGKQEDSMINYRALARMEERAFLAKRGMWAEPWAQAYHDFAEASGNRVTFNTLAKKERLVENTALMSQLSIMEAAQAQGMYYASDRMAAAMTGKYYDVGSDKVAPMLFDQPSAPHKGYMDEMLRDQAEFMRTAGTGNAGYKHSRRGGYGQLDQHLALDTMRTTTSIWNKRSVQAFETYGSQDNKRRGRIARMAAEQRRINQEFGQSHIGHHRM